MKKKVVLTLEEYDEIIAALAKLVEVELGLTMILPDLELPKGFFKTITEAEKLTVKVIKGKYPLYQDVKKAGGEPLSKVAQEVMENYDHESDPGVTLALSVMGLELDEEWV